MQVITKPAKSLIVDLSVDSTTVFNGPCLLVGIYVNTASSAHAVQIKDGSTLKMTIPSSKAAGTEIRGWDAEFSNTLVVVPNASATGNITVFYIPLNQ